ncbi:MAG: ribonuclease III [Flavobacteriales bacterium]|nr:ribonuclease III [Flavobacteriales bacterium]NQX97250.1 ribonuclease III [Flavobacteriales bacterium]
MFFKRVFRKKDEYADILERIIGFYPHQVSIYKQAFLHKSIIQNNQLQSFESNERLEFLGDAVLDSVISNYIYHKFPKKDEGYLTKLRSKLVSRQTLNNLGVKIGLQELMKSSLDRASKSVYGDALEALIGAVFLDKGYTAAQKFVEEKLLQNHIDIEEVIQTETDFKSRVIEWCQKEKLSFDYKITQQEEKKGKLYVAELLVDNIPKGRGISYTKKQAEQLASEQFYKVIQ